MILALIPQIYPGTVTYRDDIRQLLSSKSGTRLELVLVILNQETVETSTNVQNLNGMSTIIFTSSTRFCGLRQCESNYNVSVSMWQVCQQKMYSKRMVLSVYTTTLMSSFPPSILQE